MYMPDVTTRRLDELLHEDVPHGDLTTDALAIGDRPATMIFDAREAMTLSGLGIAEGLLRLVGAEVELSVEDGASVAAGTRLLHARGRAGALLKVWKQAQTSLEALSGIASAARDLVDAVTATGRDVPVACTRKTFPGVRALQAAAVRAGGCVAHRMGLSETVLLFAEHRVFLAGVPLSVTADRLRKAAPEKKLVIEVASVEEGVAAAAAGFDVIQTEKFAPTAGGGLAHLVARDHPGTIVAAAGGIHPGNVAPYVLAGASVIVTSWPYQGRPRDVQVLIAAHGDEVG